MNTDLLSLDVHPTAGLLKALADDNRLRMLALLSQGELCVCHVVEALGLGQPNVSQHLALLKAAGVVESTRRGNWVYYRIVEDQPAPLAGILSAVLAGLASLAAADQAALADAKQRVGCP